MKHLLPVLCITITAFTIANGQAPRMPVPPLPAATEANVCYGEHPRQMLDFWRAQSEKPAPVLFFIHGGSWRWGNKSEAEDVQQLLDAGISVVSINYRFVHLAVADGVTPPVKTPLGDAARALQFVRSKAAKWNIDKRRIAAAGVSAGGCSALWFAFHDDMADPMSSDPVARESTRLLCAAVRIAQTSLDPAQLKDWIPGDVYGGHAFGFFGDKVTGRAKFDEFVSKRDLLLPWIAEYSPYALVTKDDPPVYLHYLRRPDFGKDSNANAHSSNFGVKLQERCNAEGVACELVYPGAPDVTHETTLSYLIDLLNASKN